MFYVFLFRLMPFPRTFFKFLPWGYRYNTWYNKCEKMVAEYHRSALRALDPKFIRYEDGLIRRHEEDLKGEVSPLDPRYSL